MKIISDNWGKNKIEFDNISFVYFNRKENTQHTVFKIHRTASSLEISLFFKKLSQFIYSRSARKTLFSEGEYYQFVLSNKEHDWFLVKWFSLVFDNGIQIDHDIAFSTTLIKKNNMIVPLGSFPNWNKNKYPVYRQFKIKRNAYKFISNQVLK